VTWLAPKGRDTYFDAFDNLNEDGNATETDNGEGATAEPVEGLVRARPRG
jgi:hypothetical protein